MKGLGFVLAFLVVYVLVGWLDPVLKRVRQLEAELKKRSPLPDDEMLEQYFSGNGFGAGYAARIRLLFAKELRYPHELLLPDDDLGLFWYEADMAPFIRVLEKEFQIELSNNDVVATQPTIRSVSELVQCLYDEKRTATDPRA